MFSKIVEVLKEKNKTIATMESCTGGLLISLITDNEGASEITHGGYVTYSSAQKSRCGVQKRIIDSNGVYSTEVAMEMAKACRAKAGSNIGIGITGELTEQNEVYVAIIDDNSMYATKITIMAELDRHRKKLAVCEYVAKELEHKLC